MAYTSIGDVGSTSAEYTGSELAVVEFDDSVAFRRLSEIQPNKAWMKAYQRVSQVFITVTKNRGVGQKPKHVWMEVLIKGKKYSQGSVEGFKVNMGEKAYIAGISPKLPLNSPGHVLIAADKTNYIQAYPVCSVFQHLSGD